MRPVSKTFLARVLAAQIDEAACDGTGMWWSNQEAAVDAATTRRQVEIAATEALDMCAGCPLTSVRMCAERAELDRYTGIAAGDVYRNGKPQGIAVIRRAG